MRARLTRVTTSPERPKLAMLTKCRVADAPASLECRLLQVVPLAGQGNRLMIAEVLAVHLRDDCVTEQGRFDVSRFSPLSRLGYLDFATIAPPFELKRPKLP